MSFAFLPDYIPSDVFEVFIHLHSVINPRLCIYRVHACVHTPYDSIIFVVCIYLISQVQSSFQLECIYLFPRLQMFSAHVYLSFSTTPILFSSSVSIM
jgi:hypothetical protein